MKKNRKPILIYILALLVLGILIYVVPKVTDVFEDTAILETGSIQITEKTDCYFVRDEAVYEAGAAGTVKYKIKEGTHIKTGTVMAEFKEDETEGSEVMAPRSKYSEIIESLGKNAVRTVTFESKSSGVICYYADGYESRLTPENMDKLTREKALELTAKPVELKESPVRKTEPVLKICDNDNWYIVCWIESASVGNYEIGNKITVSLPNGSVDMRVENITQDGEYWKLILWSNNYYEDFAKVRVEEGLLISKDYSGLKTETSNIIIHDKKPVVLVLKKNGEYSIVKVKIKANDGQYSILEDVSFTDEDGNFQSTVNIYDEILRNPEDSDVEAIIKAAEKDQQGEKDED